MSMKSDDDDAQGRFLDGSKRERDPKEARAVLFASLFSILLSAAFIALVSALLVWPLWYLATTKKTLFSAAVGFIVVGIGIFWAFTRFRRSLERKRSARRP